MKAVAKYRFAASIKTTGARFAIPDGAAPVEDPSNAMQCWALVACGDGQYSKCRSRCRGAGGREQKRTCHAHRLLESAAQAVTSG
jgi:hypothetical protein